MSTGLKLSPKYGLNPTISVCFWCGEEKGEIALLGQIGDSRKGEDIEASMHTIIDYEPCPACLAKMESGFTVVEATTCPNDITSVPIQDGIYPTGRFVVIKPETASKIFRIEDGMNKAFLQSDLFQKIFCEDAEPT
jgi:hypothetical protein